jgi:ribose 5-phosphate isomerase B
MWIAREGRMRICWKQAMADPKTTRIVMGADNLGVDLKNAVKEHLVGKGWDVTDFGVNSADPVDYPDIALKVAEAVASGDFQRGVIVCGTGAGVAITANKVPGVRAVQVFDPYIAERAAASNNAQIITFGQLTTGPATAKMLTDIFLANDFQGGRSAPKVAKMDAVDSKYKKS